MVAVPAEKRSTEDVRQELGAQRDELVGAIADLKDDVHSARRIPIIIGGVLLAALAAVAAFKIVRGRGDDD